MAVDFKVFDTIPADPHDIYEAWLSSSGHTDMTGGQPARISDEEGTDFTLCNGYITGRNLKLIPSATIVQSWRTAEFASADPDSEVEVWFELARYGTTVTVYHRNVPDNLAGYRDGLWQKNYFTPMKKYFRPFAKTAGYRDIFD